MKIIQQLQESRALQGQWCCGTRLDKKEPKLLEFVWPVAVSKVRQLSTKITSIMVLI